MKCKAFKNKIKKEGIKNKAKSIGAFCASFSLCAGVLNIFMPC